MASAAAAADALIAAGAEEVLVFGSVARGEAHGGSDIDLVALFADIDYAKRRDLKKQLEDAADAAVGRWPTQVLVTDRPEWRGRVGNVSASFERSISTGAVVVATAATQGDVNWDKEMVKPMSNPGEALANFTERVLPRAKQLGVATIRSFFEDHPMSPPEDRETAGSREWSGYARTPLYWWSWRYRR